MLTAIFLIATYSELKPLRRVLLFVQLCYCIALYFLIILSFATLKNIAITVSVDHFDKNYCSCTIVVITVN